MTKRIIAIVAAAVLGLGLANATATSAHAGNGIQPPARGNGI